MVYGEKRKLYAIENTQLVINAADVVLDRLLTDGALARNISIGITRDHQVNDFSFARGQSEGFGRSLGRLVECSTLQGFHEIGNRVASDPALALHDMMNCPEKKLRGCFFQQDTLRAELHRPDHFFSSDGRGQQNCLGPARRPIEFRQNLKAVRPGHRKIKKKDVRFQFPSNLQRAERITSLSHNFKVRF